MKENIYKIIKIISVFFIISFFPLSAEQIRIASWNINKQYNSDQIKTAIKGFIIDNDIDVLCLQEVRLELIWKDELYKQEYKARESLLDILVREVKQKTGKEWDYITTAETAIRKNVDDYYKCPVGLDNAIFYNKSKYEIEDLSEKDSLGFKNFLTMPSKYKTDKNNTQVIKFSQLSTEKEMVIINVHLPFNERKVNHPYETNYKRDINSLWNIYQRELQHEIPTLIAGDFNLSNESLNVYSDKFKNEVYLVDKENKTTISKKNKDFNQPYDHFILEKEYQNYGDIKPQRAAKISGDNIFIGLKNEKTFFSIDEYKIYCSDHVPIIISLVL